MISHEVQYRGYKCVDVYSLSIVCFNNLVLTRIIPSDISLMLCNWCGDTVFMYSKNKYKLPLLLCLQVSAIYKDPSLDSNLRLVIVRMIFFEEEQDGQVHALHNHVFKFINSFSPRINCPVVTPVGYKPKACHSVPVLL